MEEFYRFKRKVIAGAVKVVIGVAGLLYVLSTTQFGYEGLAAGFLLGGAVSIYNFHIQALKATKIVEMKSDKAGLFAFKWALIRYPLLALALIIAVKREGINFWTTAGGFFTCPGIIIWYTFRERLTQKPENE